MKRWSSVASRGVLVGLLLVGLMYVFYVPEALLDLYHSVRKPPPFRLSDYHAFQVGDRFPDLQLKSVEGGILRLRDCPHKVLLVNFFTSY